jgi:hypothetical protein
MALFTLHLELAEPYQGSGRALDAARKMGFELVRMRLDRIAANRHRMDLGLRAPLADQKRWNCLFHHLESTPGIGKVSWDGATPQASDRKMTTQRYPLALDDK